MIRAQRRRRRLRFWLVFVVLAALGGTWAGLTKDPLGPGLMQDGGQLVGPVPQPAEVEVEVVPTAAVDVPQTTVEVSQTTVEVSQTTVEIAPDEETTTTEGS